MTKKSALAKTFRTTAASLAAVFVMNGVARAEDKKQENPAQAATAPECAAFPDFRRPTVADHRTGLNVDPDPKIKERQELLGAIGLHKGYNDGYRGMSTMQDMREFLLFFNNANDYRRELNDDDTEKLRVVVTDARKDAAKYRITPAAAATLHMAADRAGMDFQNLLRETKGDLNFKQDNQSWLYMIKTQGPAFELGFLSNHISETKKNGKTTLSVENPFIEKMIVDLKDNPRLSAVMTAEYLKHKKEMPAFDAPLQKDGGLRLKMEAMALSIIGFDVGSADKGYPRADAAKREFQILYGDGKPTGALSDNETSLLVTSAQKAHADADRLNVPIIAVAALRMATEKRGGDFGFAMELTAAESGFAHRIQASGTSATGLSQFIEPTWLDMISSYGGKYGLGDFKPLISYYTDRLDRVKPMIDNPLLRDSVNELRTHPHLSALFGVEFTLENKAKAACFVPEKDLTRTTLYAEHFMGANDGVLFVNKLREDPKQPAAQVFPEAAEYNTNVFYETTRRGKIVRERSMAEVQAFFQQKFDRGVYDAPAPENPTVMAADMTGLSAIYNAVKQKITPHPPVKMPVKALPKKKPSKPHKNGHK